MAHKSETSLRIERSSDDGSQLYTAKDVARYLNVSYKRVYGVVGHLALSLGPRRLRWRKPDLDRWLEASRRNQ